MNIDSLFAHPAFTSLLPEQLNLIRRFARDVQGKGKIEITRMYMQLNQQVNQVKPLTSIQKSAIVEAIQGFVPEGDRQKLNGFIKMLGR